MEQAKAERPAAWTCIGGTLTVTEDNQGRSTDRTTVVADDFTITPAPAPASAPASRAAADDYDSWCENGSVCGREISRYAAEVKGNGAYGDRNGSIGSIDIVYRQEFNGPWPQWRSLLIHDSGPQINPGNWTNDCRINIKDGPDAYCGRNTVNFNDINASQRRAWWPSPTRLASNESKVTDSRNYHDDHSGEFVAWGHTQMFKAGVLHTGRWNNCDSGTCKYYQVPWRP
ncbi:hypothetical protein J7F03_04190 [Streptomyces sp. ISL-43]|uniref:hypothetical protein n=1 Tax=Streptomyces sp. ISL-43 TaxID=2819183 RepID=UPI001BE5B867|nr:hypothetical protein [Streptomyces sp. ISL-43]MBT2446294.1 hypothetical protein [Streptomyces sp. ISL-43]